MPTDSFVTPEVVAGSLRIGDHRNLSRLTTWALLGFGFMAARFLTRREHVLTIDSKPDVVHVVANPVAHGARLSVVVSESLGSSSLVRVTDARMASTTVSVDLDAAGLSPRSMSGILSRAHLLRALRLRAGAGSAVRPISPNRLYREYLFLAQAVRYFAAEETLRAIAKSTTVLTDFDRHAYSQPWIEAAKHHGLRTITMVHGSPNVQNYVPMLADTALIWGDVQAEWLSHHSPSTVSTIIGRPDLEVRGTDAGPLQRAVICHSAETLMESELALLLSAIATMREAGVRSVLRLHPSVAVDQVTGPWATVMEQAEETVASRDSFVASLGSGDGVIVVTSTSAIEALTAGYRVLVLADPGRELPSDLEAMNIESSNTLDDFMHDGRAASTLGLRIVAHTGREAQERLSLAMQQAVTQH